MKGKMMSGGYIPSMKLGQRIVLFLAIFILMCISSVNAYTVNGSIAYCNSCLDCSSALANGYTAKLTQNISTITNIWYELVEKLPDTTHSKAFINGTQYGSKTFTTALSNIRYGIGATNQLPKYDNFFIAKYTEPEPTYSIETEQNSNFTWWNSSWSYKKVITIGNATSPVENLTDYQTLIIVDTQSLISAGKMQSDCDDIRFVNRNENVILDYWIESGCNTTSTKIWVKVDTLTANTTNIIYMYYGNPSATAYSNGDNTFIFFDDFNFLNTSKWKKVGTVTVSGGVANISSATSSWLVSVNSYDVRGKIFELNQSGSRSYDFLGDLQVTSGSYAHNAVSQDGYTIGTYDNIYEIRRIVNGGDATLLYSGGSNTGYYESRYSIAGTAPYNTTFFVKNTTDSKWIQKASENWYHSNYSVYIYVPYSHTSATGYSVYVDYVRIRKYTSSEPTYSIGTEQNSNFTWWNSSWQYRKNIMINNTANSNTLTDYQVPINLTYDTDMQADFSDIRFTWYNSTDSTETEIPYWIENKVNSAWAYVWVKVPSIPASSTATIYVYYGNSGASSASNGDAVFLFFDDFNDNSINTTKWGTASGVAEQNQRLEVTVDQNGVAWSSLQMASSWGFTPPFQVHVDVLPDILITNSDWEIHIGEDGIGNTWGQGFGYYNGAWNYLNTNGGVGTWTSPPTLTTTTCINVSFGGNTANIGVDCDNYSIIVTNSSYYDILMYASCGSSCNFMNKFVKNCNIYNGYVALGGNAGAGVTVTVSNISVFNNNFTNSGLKSYSAGSGTVSHSNWNVSYNRFFNFSTPIELYGNSHNITNNNINTTSYAGIICPSCLNVINNTVINGNNYGIQSSSGITNLISNYICNNSNDLSGTVTNYYNNTCTKATKDDYCFNICPNSTRVKAINELNTSELIYSTITFNNGTCNSEFSGWINVTYLNSSFCSGLTKISVKNTSYVVNLSGNLYYFEMPQRVYYRNISSDNVIDIKALLLRNDKGIYNTFYVLDLNNNPIPSALIEVKRYLNIQNVSDYYEVSSDYTDTLGSVTMFLDPNYVYSVNVSKAGYSRSFTLQPNINNKVTYVHLTGSNQTNLTIPPPSVMDGTTYQILPTTYFQSNSFTISYNLTNILNDVEWFGMSVTYKNLTNQTILFNQNWTNSTNGGYIEYTTPNMTGYYIVDAWFKRGGFPEYHFTQRTYFLKPSIPFTQEEVENWGFSKATLQFVAIIILALCVGFFSRFNPIVAGFIGLVIFGIFTFVIPIFDWYWFVIIFLALMAILYLRSGL